MAIVKRSKTAIINFPRYPSKYDLKIKSGSTKYVSKEYYQIYFLTNYMYLLTPIMKNVMVTELSSILNLKKIEVKVHFGFYFYLLVNYL